MLSLFNNFIVFEFVFFNMIIIIIHVIFNLVRLVECLDFQMIEMRPTKTNCYPYKKPKFLPNYHYHHCPCIRFMIELLNLKS